MKAVSKSQILIWVVPLIILFQPRCNFTWYNNLFITTFLIFIYFIIIFRRKIKSKAEKKYFNTILIVVGLSFIYFVFFHFQGSSLLALLCVLSIPLLTEEEKFKILNNATLILAVIVSISLPLWILHTSGIVTFPIKRALDLSIIGNEGFLDDHIFFVNNTILLFPRFYGIYEEPGAFAVLMTLLVVANRFDFSKWPIRILIIGIIFTFSLAGYLTFIVSYCVFKTRSLKAVFALIFGLLIFLILFYYLFKDVGPLQLLIFNRIENFGELGLNHRTSDDLNLFYDQYILSFDCLFGKGVGFSGSKFTGSGYKMFIIDYGIIGTALVALLYWGLGYNRRTKLIPLYVAVFLAFLPQGNAFITWQLMLFGIANNSIK